MGLCQLVGAQEVVSRAAAGSGCLNGDDVVAGGGEVPLDLHVAGHGLIILLLGEPKEGAVAIDLTDGWIYRFEG